MLGTTHGSYINSWRYLSAAPMVPPALPRRYFSAASAWLQRMGPLERRRWAGPAQSSHLWRHEPREPEKPTMAIHHEALARLQLGLFCDSHDCTFLRCSLIQTECRLLLVAFLYNIITVSISISLRAAALLNTTLPPDPPPANNVSSLITCRSSNVSRSSQRPQRPPQGR